MHILKQTPGKIFVVMLSILFAFNTAALANTSKSQNFVCPTVFEFDSAPAGNGWSTPEKQPAGNYHLWMAAQTANLALKSACRGPVKIELHIVAAMSDEILNSLKMQVDGTPVTLTRLPESKPGNYVYVAKTKIKGPMQKPIIIAFTTSKTIVPPQGNRNLAVMFSQIKIAKMKKNEE